MKNDNRWCFGTQFVKPHAERKKYFMTFTKYCPFLICNYFSSNDVEFQFSTLLLLDIARQKVLYKCSRKIKIEILLVESKGDQSVDFNSLSDKLHLVAPSGESSYLS